MIHKKFICCALAALCMAAAFTPVTLLHAKTPRAQELESNITRLHADDYDTFVSSEGVVVVFFYSNKCGPCKRMKDTFNEAAADLGDEALFGKVHALGERALTLKLGIKKVPTLILYRNGEEIKRGGTMSKDSLIEWITSELSG